MSHSTGPVQCSSLSLMSAGITVVKHTLLSHSFCRRTADLRGGVLVPCLESKDAGISTLLRLIAYLEIYFS